MPSPERETTLAVATLPGTLHEDLTQSYEDALLYELVEIPPGHLAAFYRIRVWTVKPNKRNLPVDNPPFAAHEPADVESTRALIRDKWLTATGGQSLPPHAFGEREIAS